MKQAYDPKTIYDTSFFASREGSALSASVVVPLVLQLVRNVSSVVDVGCGTGGWLSVFKENGVGRVRGLDGGAVLESGQLEIEPGEFSVANLELPQKVDERFDLCICLEVAEHLSDEVAPQLVNTLCDLSDVVLFSAALPGQGGRNHINERWPSYWVEHFKGAGYQLFDIVRGRLWDDSRIRPWYRQNILIFANKSGAGRLSITEEEARAIRPLDIVHPDYFEQRRKQAAGARRQDKLSLKQQQTIERLEQENMRLTRRISAIQNSFSWRVLRRLSRGGRSVLSLRFLNKEV